ncbi:MAG: GTPase HflX, partial [Dermabacter sp.]|nr:GTPase HflX [Dermabacter sp.]
DLLLHVVDASHPDPEGQIRAVRAVLADIEGFDVPEIVALNKADLASPETIARLRSQVKHAAVVSARTGEGIEELRALIADMLPRPSVDIDVVVPYTRGDLVSRVHTQGELVSEEFLAEGTRLVARVDETLASELAAARQ